MNNRPLKIYFAGELFDFKDLGGNLLLAGAIEKYSGSRYKVMLPQNGECEAVERTPLVIRDADFKLLFESDLIVANFDGTDLDSGTVVEFCFAKMIDMPALLLRTDFRHSGDQESPGSDPWNLMCSNYPRTEVRHINSILLYHQCRTGNSAAKQLELFYKLLAQQVIDALDTLLEQNSWLQRDMVAAQYKNAIKSIGGNMKDIFSDSSIEELVQSKIAAGIY